MDIVDQIVQNRDHILAVCTKHSAKNVRIFGSCARDDYSDSSDIDVLVNLNTQKKGFAYVEELCTLQEELQELLGRKVDLIDERALKGHTRQQILSEAVSL